MFSRVRLGTIGSDGYFTLLLSNLVLIASAGCFLLVLIYRVALTAHKTPCIPRSNGHRLVLGHLLRKGKPSPQFIARLDRACLTSPTALPSGRIVVLGGRTGADGPSEAEAGRDYLQAAGIPAAQIVLEDSSRHTLENLQHARALVDDEEVPVLITNRFHLARCGVFAAAVGLQAELCAAEERPSAAPAECLRILVEAYLLHWFYVGRTWSRLTANKKSLARIS